MKTLVVVGIMIGFCASAFGQGDSACDYCWTVIDPSCSQTANCNDYSGAETVTFTAHCTGTYNYICKTYCDSSPNTCYICMTCSKLVRTSDGATIATCITSYDGNGCESQCEDSGTVSLTLGVEYRLYVTMQRCRDVDDCRFCNICKSKARIYYPGSTCTSW